VTLMGVSDQMAVNPDLLAGVEGNDRSVFAALTKWMYAANPIGSPAWSVKDTVGVLERSRPGVAFADLTACDSYPGAAAVAATIHAPMLLLLGEQDVMTKPSAAGPIASAAPNAATVIIEGVGHLMMIERPDVVTDALVEFLRSVDQ
jgi:pimeloyl-ACP methyl ester carboxylesterase